MISTTPVSHFKSFEDFLKHATEYQWLLILITDVTDDYTSIQTKQRPLEDKATVAKTMCTIVVKAYRENQL